MRPLPSALAALVALTGCGGTAPPPPAPPALAYELPALPLVEYVVGDSARVRIEAAGQSFAVNALVSARWRMEFAPGGEAVRVTATLTDMEGRLTSPLTQPRTADESTVQGPAVFDLDPRGHATVRSLPAITPAVAQFLSGAGIVHGFFPRLPGRGVAAGDSWTDTVAYGVDESGARTDVRTVTTYTAAGDSVVDGAAYLLVRSTSTTAQSSSGSIGGMRFTQEVSGSADGHFLWDYAAGVPYETETRSELEGTMEVALSPVPLQVRVTSTVRARRAAP